MTSLRVASRWSQEQYPPTTASGTLRPDQPYGDREFPIHAAWPMASTALCGAQVAFITDQMYRRGAIGYWCDECDQLSSTASPPL
ncbi:MAG: hypothetical protein QOJ11_3479 [Frankiales bacterium]|jgi:hypothetical protein|nr:hypothetical protein [Frankiales bacterium]